MFRPNKQTVKDPEREPTLRNDCSWKSKEMSIWLSTLISINIRCRLLTGGQRGDNK